MDRRHMVVELKSMMNDDNEKKKIKRRLQLMKLILTPDPFLDFTVPSTCHSVFNYKVVWGSSI